MPTPHQEEELLALRRDIDERSAQGAKVDMSGRTPEQIHEELQRERGSFPPDPQAPKHFRDPVSEFDGPAWTGPDSEASAAEIANPHAFKMVVEAGQTGEPLFCFRARDLFSIMVISHYADIVEKYGPDDSEFHNRIVDALGEFKEWQKAHVAEVRYPD